MSPLGRKRKCTVSDVGKPAGTLAKLEDRSKDREALDRERKQRADQKMGEKEIKKRKSLKADVW